MQIPGSNIPDYWAEPENGAGPGVLVLHAWWGLNDFFKNVCSQLARDGYLACAPDLYNGRVTGTPDEALRLVSQADRPEIERHLCISAGQLLNHPAVTGPGIGVVGFSLGAFNALKLAVHPDLGFIRAVVLFYGTNPAFQAQDYARSRAAFLGHFAEKDEFEPAEGVEKTLQEIQHAGRPVQFYTYPGTRHWFAESDRVDVFNKEAAALAWDRTYSFLGQHLKQEY